MDINNNVFQQIFKGEIILAAMILVFLIFIAILLYKVAKLNKQNKQNSDSPSQGQYLNRSIAAYMPLGLIISIPIGIAIKNIAFAVAIGAVLGMAFGFFLGSKKEKKYKSDLRELSPEEISIKKLAQNLLTALCLLGIVLFVITYYIVN